MTYINHNNDIRYNIYNMNIFLYVFFLSLKVPSPNTILCFHVNIDFIYFTPTARPCTEVRDQFSKSLTTFIPCKVSKFQGSYFALFDIHVCQWPGPGIFHFLSEFLYFLSNIHTYKYFFYTVC